MTAVDFPEGSPLRASHSLRPRRHTGTLAPGLLLPSDEDARRLAQELLQFKFGSDSSDDDDDSSDGDSSDGDSCAESCDSVRHDDDDKSDSETGASRDERPVRLPVDSQGRIALFGAGPDTEDGAYVELTTRELREMVLPRDADGRPLLVNVETDDELDRYALLTGAPHRIDLLHALRTYEDAVVSGDMCGALREALRDGDGGMRLKGQSGADKGVRARVAELLCVLMALYVSPASGFRVIGGTPYADLHLLAVRVCSDQMTEDEARAASSDTRDLMGRLGAAYRALIPLVETGNIDTAEGRREALGYCDTIALGALAILGPHVAVRARSSGRLAGPGGGRE